MVLTDEEIAALAVIYRAESPDVSSMLMTEDRWGELLVLFRSLAARGFVTETAGATGPGFWITADGRAAVGRAIAKCACWCHRPEVEAYRASHSCCAAIYAERKAR